MSATETSIDSITAAGTELARYRVSSGERVVMGRRRSGGVEITDRPLQGRARAYLVDRGVRCFEQLAHYVAAYVDQAKRLDCCPMSGEAIDAILAETSTEALQQLLGEGLS